VTNFSFFIYSASVLLRCWLRLVKKLWTKCCENWDVSLATKDWNFLLLRDRNKSDTVLQVGTLKHQ